MNPSACYGYKIKHFLKVYRICLNLEHFQSSKSQDFHIFSIISLVQWHKILFSFTLCQFSLYFDEKIYFSFFVRARKFENFELSAKRQPIRILCFDS